MEVTAGASIGLSRVSWADCWAWAVELRPARAQLAGAGLKDGGRHDSAGRGLASFSGFLGHATMGGLDPVFIGVMAVMAAAARSSARN